MWTTKLSWDYSHRTVQTNSLSSLKFALLKFRVLTFLLLLPKILSSTISSLLWPREAPTIISPTKPSLFSNNRFRRVSLLVGALSDCDILSSTSFRNFPDLLTTKVWYSQFMSQKLKSPIRTRATDPKISQLTVEYLRYHPGWVVNSRHPWQHLLCYPFL